MYQREHDLLFQAIRKGEVLNDGDRMCTSTMLGIMGRMAAYTGQQITWEMAMNSQERLVPENLTWDMKHEVPPVALPGRTRFV
jgi:myo-inositol 2-dehydrogenase / D-chiro-inositol 1-dehydrogenase